MTEKELEQLKERITKGTYLLNYLKKCKEQVIFYSRCVDACKGLTIKKDTNDKKLNEWLVKLDKAKLNFKEF